MAEIKIGVVGIPGKWSTETLADAIEEKTGFRLVIDMRSVVLDLENGKILYAGQDLCQLDALVVKKISDSYSPNTLDRLELLRIAEHRGVRVFSRPENILRLIDRLSCTITLHRHAIPMPATRITEDIAATVKTVQHFGSAVLKPLYSTKARGMCVLHNTTDAYTLEQQVLEFHASNPMMYIQQKLALPGQDLGLVFLGGEYKGAYARVSNKDTWNTTIHSGGYYAASQPSAKIIELAHRAQAPFAMDFTTVDVAETESGPVVFEVSAFGGFRGSLEGCGINMAEQYTDYVLNEVGNK